MICRWHRCDVSRLGPNGTRARQGLRSLKLWVSGLSPEAALDKLRPIQQHSVSINAGAPVRGVSTIHQEQAGVFEALKLKKPTQDTQLSLL